MKSLTKSNIVVLISTIITFVILQILSFDRSFYFPLLIGIIKLVVILFGIIYTIVKVNPNLVKLIVISFLLLVFYSTYQLSLWKISASIYINLVEDDYKEILSIVDKDSSFSTIFYREEGDSLRFMLNKPEGPSFTSEEKIFIKNFMINNSYIEIWRIEYGIVFVYHRFIDNMGGVIYCPDPELQKKIESDKNEYRSYTKINENWYYHYRSG